MTTQQFTLESYKLVRTLIRGSTFMQIMIKQQFSQFDKDENLSVEKKLPTKIDPPRI